MAKIEPFPGLRYNPQKIKELDKVVTVPYDQIKGDMQDRYYNAHPYNYVRLIFGKIFPEDTSANNRYTRARDTFNKWQEEEIFIQDEKPALYFYEQRFSLSGKTMTRRGFIALLRLEDFESGIVLPHERTLSKPKADRFELMKATKCNFEQIFLIYPDPEMRINQLLAESREESPIIQLEDSDYNCHHIIWRVIDQEAIKKIKEIMEEKSVFIADGHHRYETSLNYRNLMTELHPDCSSDAPFNYRMATFINIDDSGLVILPTHRLIKNLPAFDREKFFSDASRYFNVTAFPFGISNESQVVEKIIAELNLRSNKHAFGFFCNDEHYYLLTLKHEEIMDDKLPDRFVEYRKLDVTILHTLLIEEVLGITKKMVEQEENISYIRDPLEGIKSVKEGKYQLLFLLNPTQIHQVSSIASNKEKMPQKSTDFYPKLLSGLIMYKMEI